MSEVSISPLATWARTAKYRPCPPPIFPDGDPTPADIRLALALFDELDSASQDWYGGRAFVERLQARLATGAI